MKRILTIGCLAYLILSMGCRPTQKQESIEYQLLTIPFVKGPYQNNGASPWYVELSVGTPQQPLKFGMDTGNNADWITSTQCNTPACTQPGRHSFDISASSSFNWVDKKSQTLSFGPWGNMQVNTGSDFITVANHQVKTPTNTFLSIDYEGTKFEELNWDGGIGFPAQDEDSSTDFLLEQMLNQGLIDPNNVLVSFYTDPGTGQGKILVGGYDESLVLPESKLTFPFKAYEQGKGALDYLWTSPINSFTIGNQLIAADKTFCFDTGASEFKGDTTIMNNSIQAIDNYYTQYQVYPKIEMSMGVNNDGQPGFLVIGPDQYRTKIEAGAGAGTVVTAFDPLEIEDMILVGSVLLDAVYPVFKYEAEGVPGNYQLKPIEVWLFNKANGPVIIQN